MRIREEQKAQVRSALLRAGSELIAARGIEGTTIDEITQAAGVAKGTFYNYFRTKEDLVFAAVSDRQAGWESELDAVLAARASTADRLHEVFRRVVEWISNNPELSWIWSMERLSRRGGPRPDDPTQSRRPGVLHAILERVMRAGQQGGEIPTGRSPSAFANDLEGIFLVHFAGWYLEGRVGDLGERIACALDTYLHGAIRRDADLRPLDS